jgi:hypothetical protein
MAARARRDGGAFFTPRVSSTIRRSTLAHALGDSDRPTLSRVAVRLRHAFSMRM